MLFVEDYLTKYQLELYEETKRFNNKAFDEGWHWWLRISKCQRKIRPTRVNHYVKYKNPYGGNFEELRMHPTPKFIGELMAGYIHPPIESIHNQKLLMISENNFSEVIKAVDFPEWVKKNKTLKFCTIIDNRECNLYVMEPLNYEQALSYTIMRDIPKVVWDENIKRNFPSFELVEK